MAQCNWLVFSGIVLPPRVAGGVIVLAVVVGGAGLAWGHAGHGHEFQSPAATQAVPGAVQVDAQTVQRLGIRIETLQRRSLPTGITANGQLVAAPNSQAVVTAPVNGRVVELLVEPGDRVVRGQVVLVLASAELSAQRVAAAQSQVSSAAAVAQARNQLALAEGNWLRQQRISEADRAAALRSLQAAQRQVERDRALVEQPKVVAAARLALARQQTIAQAEIAAAQAEVVLAQERFERDRELAAQGAIAQRRMQESRAELAVAQAKLTQARSQPEVARAEAEARQREAELPWRDLRQSERELATAQAAWVRANQRQDLLAAQTALAQTKTDLQAAQQQQTLSPLAYQTRLQQLASRDNAGGRVVVRSPLNGVVASRTVALGETVEEATKPLVEILGDRLRVTANVYEKDLAQVQVGQALSLEGGPGAGPRRVGGRVTRIGTVVDPATRTVAVTGELATEGNLALKPGQFVSVTLLGDRTTPVLAAPRSAVVEAAGQSLVYVQNGDRFEPAPVQLGRSSGDWVEIRQGLFEGDRIVVSQAHQLWTQGLRSPTPATPAPPAAGPVWQLGPWTLTTDPRRFIPPWLPAVGGAGLGIAAAFGGGWWLGQRRRRNSAPTGEFTDFSELDHELAAEFGEITQSQPESTSR